MGKLSPNVHDVAAKVVELTGEITCMKLQKLVYYCQAWSTVWDERVLFPERIEAWANGPVVPDLFAEHRGTFTVAKWPKGDPDKLDDRARKTISAVVEHYNQFSATQLSELSHNEEPWKSARVGLGPGERSNREITVGVMANYYSQFA